jgi:hypothetical protein
MIWMKVIQYINYYQKKNMTIILEDRTYTRSLDKKKRLFFKKC